MPQVVAPDGGVLGLLEARVVGDEFGDGVLGLLRGGVEALVVEQFGDFLFAQFFGALGVVAAGTMGLQPRCGQRWGRT